MVKIGIFASGSGTNAENVINHFSNSNIAKVTKVFSNKPNAFVIQRAEKLGVPYSVINNQDLKSSDFQKSLLEFDFIILAGFLAKIPEDLTTALKDRIINIHPSLLPKYGGQGMYGHFVHEAVIANNETKSGITIHLVNEKYDDGKILFQTTCQIESSDDADILARKIHRLEQQYFPQIIEDYIRESSI